MALALTLAAGTAWALLFDKTLVGGETYITDIVLDKGQTAPAVSTRHTFNTIKGNGIVTGGITANVDTGSGSGDETPIVLSLYSAADTVKLAPAATKVIGQSAYADPNHLQIIVNGPRDGATTNNGTVFIKGGNNDAPIAAHYNRYYGGTFVYGGTLAISNNNSLGQRWVALMARSPKDSRKGATLVANGTTRIYIGGDDLSGATKGQPLYLVNPFSSADEDGRNSLGTAGIQQAFINVDEVDGLAQTLNINQGIGEIAVYSPASNDAGIPAGDAWPDTLLTLDEQKPYTRVANANVNRYAQLVKTGVGVLEIGYSGTGIVDPNPATWVPTEAVNGARHEGGTVLLAGTTKMVGSNAATWKDHYTGYLGSVWKWGDREGAHLVPGHPKFYENSAATIIGQWPSAIHNPLIMEGTAKLELDRSQIFSFFRGQTGNEFFANKYTLAGTNYRPWIIVGLNRQHSDYLGFMKGFYDLHLRSTTAALGASVTPAVDVPAQATLKIGNANNDIVGETWVENGVLSVQGAKSIAHSGSGNLYVVGQRYSSSEPYKSVFLGLANATFENATFVVGRDDYPPKLRAAETIANANSDSTVVGDGALAAATGVTTSYKTVEIAGAMEINPQAVEEIITERNNDAIKWVNNFTYPTWGGTVRFGGEGATYKIGGDDNRATQITVSRGIWHLDSLPADNGTGFANVTLRETATLSLGKDVNNFSKAFDLQIDDDSRIRVMVRESDLATSRAAALKKDAMVQVRTMDVTWLGSGPENKDRRLAAQLDLAHLPTKVLKKGTWIKFLEAEDAISWNNIHYLRDNSDTFYEDYAKVRPGFVNLKDDHTTKVVAHVNENPYIIFLEVTEDASPDPTPQPPTPPTPPTPTPTPSSSSGGGCDAGFAGLALLLAVPMFFRKKD